MGFYHTAQICLNGHIINGFLDKYPEHNQNFCNACGAKTISQCPSCNADIRGAYEWDFASDDAKVPSYCHNCGKPYPWTQIAIDSTKELILLNDSASDKEKEYLNNNVQSLLVDTPKTKVVATKFKIFLKTARKEIGTGLKDILVDIISESAKKIIWPTS